MTSGKLLILFAAIIIGFTFSGVMNGFLKMAVSLASSLLVLWLVAAINPVITGYVMNNTDIYEEISGRVDDALKEVDIGSGGSTNPVSSEIEGALAQDIGESLGVSSLPFAVPSVIENLLLKSASDAAGHIAEMSRGYIVRFLSGLAVKIAVFLITYLIVRLIVFVAMMSVDVIDEIPVLHSLNRFAGGVLGALEGLIVVWLIMLFMTVFWGGEFFDALDSDAVLSFLYNNNVFLTMLSPWVK